MSFLDARHLLAEALHVGAVQVGAGGREVGAVVDGVDRAQRIPGGKMWSNRTVPKSSRMVCRGLLNASEIPPKSGAPGLGAGHALISGETPTSASPEAGQGLGAGLTSLQGR